MHTHSHNHTHHAHGVPANLNRAFIVGIILNILYVAAEGFFGLHINSLALLSDAGHNLSDVLSLILAWLSQYLIGRKAFGQFTYGLKKSSIVIAIFNTLLLLLAIGIIMWESVERFYQPHQAPGLTMSAVAFVGILVNGFTAFLFYSSSQDLNLKSTFWHMASDALVSAGVVVAGIVLYFTNWYWIDPAISLVIVVVILISMSGLLIDSFRLFLDAAPKSIQIADVTSYLLSIPGVTTVHDLHIWNISTQEIALTVHLIIPAHAADDQFLKNIEEELFHRFAISHSTIQVERGTHSCVLGSKEC